MIHNGTCAFPSSQVVSPENDYISSWWERKTKDSFKEPDSLLMESRMGDLLGKLCLSFISVQSTCTDHRHPEMKNSYLPSFFFFLLQAGAICVHMVVTTGTRSLSLSRSNTHTHVHTHIQTESENSSIFIYSDYLSGEFERPFVC